MVMATAIYWQRGSTQARMMPENALGGEESGKENDHKGGRDDRDYIKKKPNTRQKEIKRPTKNK